MQVKLEARTDSRSSGQLQMEGDRSWTPVEEVSKEMLLKWNIAPGGRLAEKQSEQKYPIIPVVSAYVWSTPGNLLNKAAAAGTFSKCNYMNLDWILVIRLRSLA